uniref:Putative secreted protein n=1 Tax=Ixodes ricinus TaxID=34613 RepID=A0A6B0TSB4_IXORI
MVALYWLLNFLFTYWFIKDVLPTPLSPRMITLSSTFFLDDMVPLSTLTPFNWIGGVVSGVRERRLGGVVSR